LAAVPGLVQSSTDAKVLPLGDILIFVKEQTRGRQLEAAFRRGPAAWRDAVYVDSRNSQAFIDDWRRRWHTRVWITTNVAQVSVTIPHVGCVISLCRHNVAVFDQIQAEWIDQASAKQKRGRAGRQFEGIWICLMSRLAFAALPQAAELEILRTPLEKQLLKALDLGLVVRAHDTSCTSDLISPPTAAALKDAAIELESLHAIENFEINALGKILASLPMEPRYGKALLLGGMLGVVRGPLSQAVMEMQEVICGKASRGEGQSDTMGHVVLLDRFLALPERHRQSWCLREECSLVVLRRAALRAKKLVEALKCVLPERRSASAEGWANAVIAFASVWNCGTTDGTQKVKVDGHKYKLHASSGVSLDVQAYVSYEQGLNRKIHGATVHPRLIMALFGGRAVECTEDTCVLDKWLTIEVRNPRQVEALRLEGEALFQQCAAPSIAFWADVASWKDRMATLLEMPVAQEMQETQATRELHEVQATQATQTKRELHEVHPDVTHEPQ
jgi:hypothetical protein